MLQTITFLAGGRQIDAKATFFRYESGNAGGADESIRVRADGNDLGIYYPGDGIELPISATRWEIVPVSAVTTGTVRLGMGRVQSARLVGVVNVVDTSKARTMANQSFLDYRFAISTAALSAVVQIWNPVGSGKRLIVAGCSSTFNVGGVLNFGLTTVAAPTLFAGLKSKLSGGAAASSVLRTDQNATASATYGFVSSAQAVAANAPFDWKFRDPIVLVPGSGLVVYNDLGPAGLLFATFDANEEPI